MTQQAPNLPTRFPCWCRATYSWGGETKRDLGFIEGDLIECLNAGDGSWWMGRLHRDKRAMGLFPSNFVQLLDDTFRPITRQTTPLPSTDSRGSSPNPTPQKNKTFRKPFQAYASTPGKTSSVIASPTPSPQKAKTTFRKPFQAYAQPTPRKEAAPVALVDSSRGHSSNPARKLSFLQQPSKHSSTNHDTPSRQPSYIEQHLNKHTRQPSYLEQNQSDTLSRQPSYLEQNQCNPPSRQPSYLEYNPSDTPSRQPSYLEQHHSRAPAGQDSFYGSRAPSPSSSMQFQPIPATEDEPYKDNGSSPPPPAPPPHRIAYTVQPARGPSPAPSMNDRYPIVSRGPSPAPLSPVVPGLTPSPLRDAMEDVMTSLHDMELRRDVPSPSPEQEPLNPWSPEAFDELRTNARRRNTDRPRSSLGIGVSERDQEGYSAQDSYQGIETEQQGLDRGPAQLDDYDNRTDSSMYHTYSHSPRPKDELFLPDEMGPPPAPPPKNSPFQPRPTSSMSMRPPALGRNDSDRKLKNRKSAYELGREMLGRTFTNKSSTTNSSSGYQSVATNSTSSTQRTSQSLMSGYSAGGFSATSAGSLARKKGWGGSIKSRPMSVVDTRQDALLDLSKQGSSTRPQTPASNDPFLKYQSTASSSTRDSWVESTTDSGGLLGGLIAPKAKKSGFFKKLVESAKTGAASARSSIAAGQANAPRSPIKSLLPDGVTAIAGGSAAKDMGLGGGTDWVQVRRDVNRSNSLSHNERVERAEKCQMMDYPVISPVETLFETAEGDEGANGHPVYDITDFSTVNFQLVDKSARFVNSLPPMTNPTSLSQGYVCRPYRSDVQRLRAIFTWVSERVAWEEDFEGEVDSRRVIQMRRGCAEEVAVLVMEMCHAMNLHAEVVRGYLKTPGEPLELDSNPMPNHWWNAVIVDDEWRIMDCSLASPTNPQRGQYSGAGAQVAETAWFLARPMEICYTHIPSHIGQQHICPPISPIILMALPCACPPYFKNSIRLVDYDTSLSRIENLELVHIQFIVPEDIECVADVVTRSYARDADGDLFESGDITTTRALAQAEWTNGQKRYVVKAHLPSDEGQGILKVYAGKRGLMHSIKDNPHPLAFAIPITHTGNNPPYEFLLRHPTPHAQRHDLYVAQPQCARLAVNNTFVFAVRQHPSSLACSSPPATSTSPFPFTRPSSAMSMVSSAASTSDYFGPVASNASSNPSSISAFAPLSQQNDKQEKPAKLAIQAPSGKILRLVRKSDNTTSLSEGGDGGVWETIIKIGERGTWRGLVLADRSARWCVFGEWECF